jgi:phenylalanyl-tRNA synthetase beta chain
MQVSYNWLKDYVDCPWSAQELADRLTAAGIAVDRVETIDDDETLEVDLTPNRGDCLGMLNLAREAAALNGGSVRQPKTAIREGRGHIEEYITLRVDDSRRCPRFAGRIIRHVTVGPSPSWMQERLNHSGIRPINNIVDVTNYVMLEMNQPLHAYDYDYFLRKEIVVRTAAPGETMTTLDDVVRQLLPEDLLITEAGGRPVGLAGVMGGQNSQVLDSTKVVFLEAANFERVGVRKTAKRLNLRSESSVRFEKGCDAAALLTALDRAAYLMQEYAGGEVVSGVADIYPRPQEQRLVELRPERVNSLLGLNLSTAEIDACLSRLFMPAELQGDVLRVSVPTYRPDLEAEVDLIEEVARIYGYDRIPLTFPVGRITPGELDAYQVFRDKARAFLAQELLEVITYSFIAPRAFDLFGLSPDDARRQCIRLANPLSEDQSVMRTFLLPGLMETAAYNIMRQNQGIAFFEMGNVFHPVGDAMEENIVLAGVMSGRTGNSWLKNQFKLDFYYGKGVVEGLFKSLNISADYRADGAPDYYHPGCSAAVESGGRCLGFLGMLHPDVIKRYGLKEPICAFEFDLASICALSEKGKTIRGFSKFPAVARDLAVLVDATTPAQQIVNAVLPTSIPHLAEVNIFDVYAGEQVPSGYKSIAVNFVFQSFDHTLTDEEIIGAMTQIEGRLAEELQAKLRG